MTSSDAEEGTADHVAPQALLTPPRKALRFLSTDPKEGHVMSTRSWFRLNRHDEPAPTPDPAPDGGKPADGKVPQFTGDFDPDRAARALASAREAEKAAKAQAQEALAKAQEKEDQLAKVLKALGKDGEEPPDPAALTAQIEQAQAAAWRSGVELAVHRAAGRLGGDAERLLDSNSFIDTLDDLVEADPSSAEFRSALEAKVTEALERNPYYKTATVPTGPRPDPGQGGRPPVVTDFTKADHKDFAEEARKYGIRPRTYS